MWTTLKQARSVQYCPQIISLAELTRVQHNEIVFVAVIPVCETQGVAPVKRCREQACIGENKHLRRVYAFSDEQTLYPGRRGYYAPCASSYEVLPPIDD